MTIDSKRLVYWFIFQNERLLIAKNKELPLLTNESIEPLKATLLRQHRLIQFDEFDVYCAEIANNAPLSNEIETIPLRGALELLGDKWYRLLSRAYSVINLDKNHNYCGRCGSLTMHKDSTFERTCPFCGLIFYPRISPTIIVLIRKGPQLLMARSPHFKPGVYALIAGFVEAGESLEEAIHREVKEETNLQVKNLSYFGSQAWPFPDSLMVGFMADYAGGELKLDYSELEEANWYNYDQLPGLPSSSISISRKLIDHFVQTQKAAHQK